MKKLSWYGVLILLIIPFLLTDCKKKDDKLLLKVGYVAGVGSLNDNGFNQQAYNGLLAAAKDISISYEVKESSSPTQLESNIQYFASHNFDVVISIGYEAMQYTVDAAMAYPSTKFILLDNTLSTIPQNLVCNSYQIDQAAFPCGFLAAYWAWYKNPVQAAVGYVAGPNVAAIQQFTVSFAKGVDYFNSKYSKSVAVYGANATSFNDTLQGAYLADSLIQKGAEVIFACAGKTGNGALYKAKEASKTAIGVDTDQYFSIPLVGPNLLTSCTKSLDVFVRSELNSIYNEQFHGGQIIQSNLGNMGVGLAPYHNYDSSLPDSIKQAVLTIKTGIINGTIITGWPK